MIRPLINFQPNWMPNVKRILYHSFKISIYIMLMLAMNFVGKKIVQTIFIAFNCKFFFRLCIPNQLNNKKGYCKMWRKFQWIETEMNFTNKDQYLNSNIKQNGNNIRIKWNICEKEMWRKKGRKLRSSISDAIVSSSKGNDNLNTAKFFFSLVPIPSMKQQCKLSVNVFLYQNTIILCYRMLM